MFQVFVQFLDRPPSAGGFQNLISFLSPSAGRTELNKFHASMLLPKFPTLGDEKNAFLLTKSLNWMELGGCKSPPGISSCFPPLQGGFQN